jgi:hypothetical protein
MPASSPREAPTLGVFGGVVDVSGFTHQSNAEVWDSLREEIARTPKGEWIFAMGIDPILVPDLEMPTRKSLDAMAPDHPVVMVSQTMHSFWANSRAFAEAGITRDTVDPGKGSFYERDAEGELTGFISTSRLRCSRSSVTAAVAGAVRACWTSCWPRASPRSLRRATRAAGPGPPCGVALLRPRIRQFFYLA